MKLTEKQYKQFLGNQLEIKQNKYKNKKVVIDGIEFDSKKEGNYYLKLKTMQDLGIIRELKVQPKFLLIDTIYYKNKVYPKTNYIADFQYIENDTNKIKVIDIKSKATAKDKVYRLKIKMLLNKYPDIDFEEVI